MYLLDSLRNEEEDDTIVKVPDLDKLQDQIREAAVQLCKEAIRDHFRRKGIDPTQLARFVEAKRRGRRVR